MLLLHGCYLLHVLRRLEVKSRLAQVVQDVHSRLDWQLVKLLVLDLQALLLLLGQLVVVKVFDLLRVDVAVVDVLLLLGLVFLPLLDADFVLALDEERVLLSQVNFKQLHELELVRLPGGRVLVLKLGQYVAVL